MSKKIISFMLILCLLIGFYPAAALSGNTSDTDAAPVAPTADISVMSYNILDWDTHASGYHTPSLRAQKVVRSIARQNPDIIGIQEAGDSEGSNGNFDWNDYLRAELGRQGYDCRQLTEESVKPSRMTIGAGLMIFWKRDRFTKLSSGSAQYKNITFTDSKGNKNTDTSRYYHYVQLKDNRYGTALYMFNTHFSINPSGSIISSERVKGGQYYRSLQAEQLSAKMKELSEFLPCFATGDYNCSYDSSVDSAGVYNEQLYRMSRGKPFTSSFNVADRVFPSSVGGMIDHCFINQNYTTVRLWQKIYDDEGGWQPSDHRATMTYADYTAAAEYGAGAYDPAKHTLEDATTAENYVFSVTPVSEKVSVKIFDENEKQVTGAARLLQRTNRFSLRFYNNNELYNTVNATIVRGDLADQPAPIQTDEGEAYYSNGAYYVLTDQENVSPVVTGGTLYHEGAALQTLPAPAGKSDYTVKIGEKIYPLYVCHPNADARAYYVSGALSGAIDRGAWFDDENVIAVRMGENGFATLAEALSAAPEGADIYLAPGVYDEKLTITKSVNLLGNNRGRSPLQQTDDNHWSLSERAAESLFCGEMTTTENVRQLGIDGLAFSGESDHGPVVIYGKNTDLTITLDIVNNIFSADATNTGNGSQLYLNSAIKKTGEIKDNYFGGSTCGDGNSYRMLTLRNPRGLAFTHNYIRDFQSTCFISGEVADGDKRAGNIDFIFRSNRLENCGSISTVIRSVFDGGVGNAQFYYNDFIRCGYPNASSAIYLSFEEFNGRATEYEKCAVTVMGNRFINCYRSLAFIRNNNLQGDASALSLTVTQNRFIEPNQYQRAATININAWLTPEKTVQPADWQIGYNYFYSSVNNSCAPQDFITNKTTTLPALPYYTDTYFSALSDGTTPDAPSVTVLKNTFEYDGSPHTPRLSVPEGSFVTYSTDGKVYSFTVPSITGVGALTVWYQVEVPGAAPIQGQITLRVTPGVVRGVRFASQTVTYDGHAHSLTPEGLQPGDQVSYTYNGVSYVSAPTFITPGSYEITMTLKRPGCATIHYTATLTIRPAQITDITLSGYQGVYDGAPHGVRLSGTLASDTVEYRINDGAFTQTAPQMTDAGEYSVTVRVTRVGVEPLLLTAKIEITPAPLTDVTVLGVRDGQVILDGTVDEIAYSADGTAFSETLSEIPSGQALWVRVRRKNYAPRIFLLDSNEQSSPFLLSLFRDEGTLRLKISFAEGFDGATRDVHILACGLLYGSADKLFAAPQSNATIGHESETGLTRLPETTTFAVQGDARAFIRYELDGKIYTAYSPISLL